MTTAAICATREVSWGPSLYRGEQYDSDLGLYYLRARYYNPATGRFMSRDPLDGDPTDPKTLHKYVYAGSDPVNAIDPSGRDILSYLIRLAKEPAVVLAVAVATSACIVYALEEAFGLLEMPEGPERTIDDRACAVLGAIAFLLAGLAAAP
jgi:RHS repeat-associated protein